MTEKLDYYVMCTNCKVEVKEIDGGIKCPQCEALMLDEWME